jgi:predicted peroxiredoxin
MDYSVAVFLTLAGTHWAYRETGNDVRVPGHLCLEEYFASFVAAGGELLVCSPCIAAYCHLPAVGEADLRRGLRENATYVGLATVAERMMRGNATVF